MHRARASELNGKALLYPFQGCLYRSSKMAGRLACHNSGAASSYNIYFVTGTGLVCKQARAGTAGRQATSCLSCRHKSIGCKGLRDNTDLTTTPQ